MTTGTAGITLRVNGRGRPLIPEILRGPPSPPVPQYPQPYMLTRPPTGPITRGKTNKGSYYTLLLKDTKADGEGTLDTTGTKEQ